MAKCITTRARRVVVIVLLCSLRDRLYRWMCNATKDIGKDRQSLYLGSSSSSRDDQLLPRLCGETLFEQQGHNVRGLGAAEELSADGTLGAFGLAGGSAVFPGDEGFHEAGVAEEVAWSRSVGGGKGVSRSEAAGGQTTGRGGQVGGVVHADDAGEGIEGGRGLRRWVWPSTISFLDSGGVWSDRMGPGAFG